MHRKTSATWNQLRTASWLDVKLDCLGKQQCRATNALVVAQLSCANHASANTRVDQTANKISVCVQLQAVVSVSQFRSFWAGRPERKWEPKTKATKLKVATSTVRAKDISTKLLVAGARWVATSQLVPLKKNVAGDVLTALSAVYRKL